jgi:hypothetical protein
LCVKDSTDHQSTPTKYQSQLVLKQFNSKREAKQAINKEKIALVQQQQSAMTELIRRHHAAML